MNNLPLSDRLVSAPANNADVESWVVNTVKLSLLLKFDRMLGIPGKKNLRKLLLVPIFTIAEMAKRVDASAPELKTVFYSELHEVMNKAEIRFKQ